MLAQLCCRRHVARAETAALTCLAAAVLAFATMPSFLSMSAWRVLLVAGCTALLVLHDWPCLALRRASRPYPVSATTAPAGAPPSPPPSPRGDDGQTCGSCKKDFGPGRGFWVHLGRKPSCKLAHFARLRAGPVAPAPPVTSAASEGARRSLHKGFMKTAVSDSLATLRIDKLVGGTTVGDVKDAVRDWLGLVDTELRRKLCSREHSVQETAAVISETLHVFQGLETEAQEMAYLKRPQAEGGVPYLKVTARLLGERTVFGSRKRVSAAGLGPSARILFALVWACWACFALVRLGCATHLCPSLTQIPLLLSRKTTATTFR